MPRTILFVGRFDEVKGGDLAVKAFGILAEKNPHATMTFVGPDVGVRSKNGSLLSFEEFTRSTLSQQARARLTFRGGLPHAELAALRRSHFLTLCASRSEIFPYSVLEAMSFGCPIVSTDVGGISEMIRHEGNGLLVPCGDATALAAVIQRLLDDSVLARQLAKQAWLDCVEKYSTRKIAECMVDLYRNAVDLFNRER